MSIESSLSRIRSLRYCALSKEHYGSRLPEFIANGVVESSEDWLVPCSHVFSDPANEAQIAALASDLDLELPTQLEQSLGLANGAELFRLHYQPAGFGDYWIARYRLLGCSELASTNLSILDTFLSYAECDDEYRGVTKLNYLAFCDLYDGNYLALGLEEDIAGSMFFLQHDYGFYPHTDELATEAYTHVADSFDEWLDRLARTNGRDGMGGRFVPI